MHTMSFNTAVSIVEAAFWPDGPRCPRCPKSRRFVRVLSRNGRWHRCLSCYTATSATANTFLHKVRSPLNKVLCLIALRIASPKAYVATLAAEVGLSVIPARNILRLWKAHKSTPKGKRLFDELISHMDTNPVPPQFIEPSHPLHGLL